ncbi:MULTISPECIES: BlaI/MecI/CopY family transcriptional regulator [Hungatella]|jgi:BlaI family penicillinase repressor|uniref:BlaI/MecI/CopY family transcriptional regulator n=1 Tax=Hungatella TaxID=1649459 RepID=UPI0011DC7B1A|nr:BlaI/MecI/CopY family transcriptional regulator [Hungatella hathewayi]
MSRLPQISEAEYEVMKVIWSKAPINTNEVTDSLLQATDWSPKTIQTLLKRLVQKGAITYEKKSRVFVYTPLVVKEDYLNQESEHFLKRFFNGNLTSLVASYMKDERISQEELEELRSLLLHDGEGEP